MSKLKKLVAHFQRNYIARELAKCTKAQRDFFYRIYPNGPSESQMYNAADIIERTIIKNEAKKKKLHA